MLLDCCTGGDDVPMDFPGHCFGRVAPNSDPCARWVLDGASKRSTLSRPSPLRDSKVLTLPLMRLPPQRRLLGGAGAQGEGAFVCGGGSHSRGQRFLGARASPGCAAEATADPIQREPAAAQRYRPPRLSRVYEGGGESVPACLGRGGLRGDDQDGKVGWPCCARPSLGSRVHTSTSPSPA